MLRTVTRKARIDIISSNVQGDVASLLFSDAKGQKACRLFVEYLKEHKALTRQELSQFGRDLEAGKIDPAFCYSRGSFYVQIRRALLRSGLIAVEQRFNHESFKKQDLSPERKRRRETREVYVPVQQPIPRRPPDGVNLPRLCWIVCKKWNREFGEIE